MTITLSGFFILHVRVPKTAEVCRMIVAWFINKKLGFCFLFCLRCRAKLKNWKRYLWPFQTERQYIYILKWKLMSTLKPQVNLYSHYILNLKMVQDVDVESDAIFSGYVIRRISKWSKKIFENQISCKRRFKLKNR